MTLPKKQNVAKLIRLVTIVLTLRTNFVPLEQPVLDVMLSSWMNSQSLPLTTMLPSMVAVKMLSKAMEMMALDLIVLVMVY